ncbi:hypothetical protein, unlikely [Trypanosoma brucei gambiense DAL972]|uniref:Uncharacterized protein n=1 Tax=Trypanosoma brucei gambiense (strain MHOM/CI/86/DAL972) TaxID=679716 RepID=C9ZYA7_TRYB9|nr:hypothetical protein, unlikely [Trypanosoma brucei gambiense DAL972]CBH14406.1 hypothetical protein, unlikely [Trypanosoma brucei gambiense DAL972]|eukprot:XP_011776672.1 hypothetical protein, unlikely [Trypanosoma brucei gambiense DAL972]
MGRTAIEAANRGRRYREVEGLIITTKIFVQLLTNINPTPPSRLRVPLYFFVLIYINIYKVIHMHIYIYICITLPASFRGWKVEGGKRQRKTVRTIPLSKKKNTNKRKKERRVKKKNYNKVRERTKCHISPSFISYSPSSFSFFT